MHDFSIRTARLEVYAHETGILAYTGTCWFARKATRVYLVSNYHILSGKRAIDDKPFHKSNALPGKIRVLGHMLLSVAKSDPKTFQAVPVPCYFDLHIGEHEVVWNSALKTDVAAIDITEKCSNFPKEFELACWNLNELSSPVKPLGVMQDLFIIGFPNTSLAKETNSPIFKAASIASEPVISRSSAYFLADGKTKSGMSGSPVVIKDGFRPFNSTIDGMKGVSIANGELHLVGVYSGRDENDPDLYTAELGKVWLLQEALVSMLA